ncbi:Transporter of the ATP-binding cassette (ABC) [Coemansia interrupta]|uniref:Transporter of the ATP-binding cassette (ABC) n=1 Tax=Coemansia interrupta TaxID=1126814 RepID=A0A9W8HP02_9FUNG|nr:Transporter of the ATP-binding cassette (ABC) [Coemansia interrupta]
MDEATASVDFDTDSRIQRTIRGSEFANSTLFCVAHRLRTIIDYDRVLVLDKGKVVEFDTPTNLLQKSDGIFKGMCEQSGEYDQLVKLAFSELSAKSLRRCSKGSWEEQDDNAKKDKPQTTAATDGKIMNLLTADFNRILDASSFLNNFYSLPVKLIFGIWYMYALLGPSALVGLTIYALFVPFSRLLFRRFSKVKNKLASLSDERVTVITELLQGIKAVKLFGWESRFLERVDKSREIQLAYMWKMMMAWVRVEIVSMLAPILILVSIFIVYVAVGGNRLTAEVAFTSISVFNLIRSAFERIPTFFNSNISGYVSLKRIDEYLQQAEVQCLEDRVDLNSRRDAPDVGFENAVLDWSINQTNTRTGSSEQTPLLSGQSRSDGDLTSSFVLKDINVRFPSGGLSLVAGPTGSGKTSLLSALIGEMNLTHGRILLPTTRGESLTGNELAVAGIAYVAQEAWLRNATIRENILFGEPYDQQRYEEVLWMCALKPDLRILIAGDMTEIGERGITLSGGQKQRVALARAVYSSRRILLIDDCLSAVDAPTARHILTECLVGKSPLMQGRTRVLVTHHVSLCLPFAQYLVMLHEGNIVTQGSPSELMAQDGINHVIAELERQHSSIDDDEQTNEDAIIERNLKTEDVHNDERRRAYVDQHGLSISMDLSAVQAQLFKDEEREEGYVKLETWAMYLTACGGKKYWISALVFLVGFQLVTIFQDYWVRIWVTANEKGDNHHSATFWISVYLSIGFAGALWQLIQRAFIYRGTINACRRIHARLVRSVLRATPRFFDSTPLGRIINRFSRDMQVVDEKVIGSILEWMMNTLGMLSIFAIISLVTPLFTMVALLVSLIYITLTRYYLNTSRELMRLGSNGMSPLLSLFSEIIQGVSTVRAFGASQTYIKEALNLINTNNRASYMLGATQRWLALRVEAAGAFVSFACAVLLLRNLDWIDSGLAGFMLSYSLTCSDRMLWAIRNHGSNELNMTAVERISQYLNIEQENVLHSLPGREPPRDWPSSGETLIEDLVVEYVPGTPVLHGISLYARHGEKIGVVGRTGAGKSTLSLAFMRFIEARSGRIVLDGVDISQIGLEELRRNVTIIPQDPVLFNGTIRFNLDPFDEYPDELVWDALKRAYLVNENSSVNGSENIAQHERMTGIFNSLNNEIKENGQNLSLGQRQLVALARALVRRSRLIVMDEATASVDFDTDSRIQRTIRGSEFANSTLFCVAHRLRTIIDYDRVLVLDKGKVVEFDTPTNLLQKSDGIFKNMCEQSGEYEQLVKLSRNYRR